MSKTQEFEFNITTPDLSIPNPVVIFQWMPKPACCFFPSNMHIYCINTSEIPSELSPENFISSRVIFTCKEITIIWLHNKSRL